VIDLDRGWSTERLDLEPLAVAHAAELAPLLDDASLHEFTGGAPLPAAEVAWVVVRPAQGRGYGTEAARSLVALLHEAGWTVVAHIHPGHLASQQVARSAGLSPTADVHDGEIRWPARRRRGSLASVMPAACSRRRRAASRLRASSARR
jgi:RimJ/RimL family protein N-acetyltransferase